MRGPSSCLCATLAAALLAGCGGRDERKAAPGADPPAKAPAGWRTVANRDARFTVAAPRSWTARTRRRATLLRSRDRLVVVTVAADRSRQGRELPPAEYAESALEALPGFEGSVEARPRRVRGSPYSGFRIDGSGRVSASRAPQRLTVAALQRPGDGTYAVVVFRNPGARGRADRQIERLLATLRAG